jgi:hypothetical protein
MMTETISPAESQAAESPRLPRPETDGAARRAIEDARHIQDCVDQILAKIDPGPAAG